MESLIRFGLETEWPEMVALLERFPRNELSEVDEGKSEETVSPYWECMDDLCSEEIEDRWAAEKHNLKDGHECRIFSTAVIHTSFADECERDEGVGVQTDREMEVIVSQGPRHIITVESSAMVFLDGNATKSRTVMMKEGNGSIYLTEIFKNGDHVETRIVVTHESLGDENGCLDSLLVDNAFDGKSNNVLKDIDMLQIGRLFSEYGLCYTPSQPAIFMVTHDPYLAKLLYPSLDNVEWENIQGTYEIAQSRFKAQGEKTWRGEINCLFSEEGCSVVFGGWKGKVNRKMLVVWRHVLSQHVFGDYADIDGGLTHFCVSCNTPLGRKSCRNHLEIHCKSMEK
eukprot:TRINITY_DN125_c0_g1_i6.p1 TRINITY_DN125_c0_g1~~TRINITY_DN125_c0_g1_i6.p1  ORF type:complete len:341 (-),score=78.20 TRINITY_DN125_c0_g1_i6:105-1127(-)